MLQQNKEINQILKNTDMKNLTLTQAQNEFHTEASYKSQEMINKINETINEYYISESVREILVDELKKQKNQLKYHREILSTHITSL